MRRYWLAMGGLLTIFLLLFALAEALRLPLLVDPSPWPGPVDFWRLGLKAPNMVMELPRPDNAER